jgi:clan AA aspartic protease (TIGR02281 family)
MSLRDWRRHLALGLGVCALSAVAWSADAATASSCKLAKVGVVPLTMDGNQPLVSAVINGKTVHMLLDTGANSSVISRPGATRLGLHVRDNGGTFSGIDGSSRLLQSIMDTIDLGTYHGEDVRVLVGGYADFGATDDVVGVLGMDFLERNDLEFDFAHNLLNLYKPENCETAELAYWSDSYSMAEMDGVWRTRASIRLVITINGEPMHALLDSGATVSLLDAAAVRRLGRDKVIGGTGPEADAKAGGGIRGIGGYAIPTLISTFDSISIGDETIKNAKLRHLAYVDDNGQLVTDGNLAGVLGGGLDMILGADFLRSHRVFVAFSQRKIYFTYAGGPIFQTKGEALVRKRDDNAVTPADQPADGLFPQRNHRRGPVDAAQAPTN